MSFSDDGSISITATAEDANLDLSGATIDSGQTETIIEAPDSGTASIQVTQDVVKNDTEPKELTMPEKFANAENPQEALLKAYMELEKNYSKPKTEVDSPAAEKAMDELTTDRKKAEAVESYSELWAKQQGSLTDEQWAKASEELSIPVDDLKAYETYRKSELESGINSNDKNIYEWSGGEDKYNQMIEWAETAMTQGQLDALNSQLDNPQFSQMGVNMLTQMYTNAVGQEPSVSTTGMANSTTGGEMFHSESEVLAAQKHKEYGMGGAYDKQFDQKLMRFMKATGQM
jgi:hypothetical protein